MKTRIPALIAGLALGGSMLLATAGVATAAQPANAGPAGKGVCVTEAAAVKAAPASVDALRAFGDCEINRRLNDLGMLASKIGGSKVLTSSDKAALAAIVSAEQSGLAGLKTTIDSETDIKALRADIVKIATDFRECVLVMPQVNLVSAADGVLAAQAKFSQIDSALQKRIDAAKAAGKDVAAAQAALDAMNASVTAAVNLATPLPAPLLALTPAQYNAGTAGPIIASARTALGHARDDLKSAATSAKAARGALK